jgi:hypothetical protein
MSAGLFPHTPLMLAVKSHKNAYKVSAQIRYEGRSLTAAAGG